MTAIFKQDGMMLDNEINRDFDKSNDQLHYL